MTQDLGSEDLGAVWQGALNELTTLAGQPDSGIPALRHLERTLLFMATPDLHVNGYLILKTHNQRAKQFIETDFAPYIKEVVGRHLGEALAHVVSLLNPSVIVVGGPLVDPAQHLLAGVREVVYGRSLPLAT